jgi:hypothetical protein
MFELGARVSFADANATISDGVPGVSVGIVNGPPLDANGRTYIPVFAERDHGREATTILVAEENLLGRA